ncbi:Peptidase C39 related protein [Deinococcus phoenicis]|uniref:Peptidase C39 related protein n=1 Tax=Deinococcus phoenicis TaxID=1476583 RepID=A0A016QQ74_9DEIO|nr:peptidase C39 family protein [Deinococcus phoenicis]EYB68116.1 Peptidase C39 related protein [Deinococcus phoenicis]
MQKSTLPALLPAALLLAACTTAPQVQAPPRAEAPLKVTDSAYSTTLVWNTGGHWTNGTLDGLRLSGDTLVLAPGKTEGTLTSNVITVNAYDQLIPSWNAETGAKGSLRVEVRHQKNGDTWTKWYTFGTWSQAEGRASVDDQKDADGTVWTDTNNLYGSAVTTRYQYRVTLKDGATLGQVAINTVNTDLGLAGAGAASDRSVWGKVLNVPERSQMIYPDGGEVWCSPTSTSMVMAFYGIDVSVPDAARGTYDAVYDGTGNWPFNVAYAAEQGLRGFVTRLPSLADAEKYIGAGIPVVASIRWKEGELPGAAIPSSSGHLLVIVGFDEQGNPVVNDPAAADNDSVQRTYPRAIFEKLWLGASGGMVYVIHKNGMTVPL